MANAVTFAGIAPLLTGPFRDKTRGKICVNNTAPATPQQLRRRCVADRHILAALTIFHPLAKPARLNRIDQLLPRNPLEMSKGMTV
jgi:hypothetical protein